MERRPRVIPYTGTAPVLEGPWAFANGKFYAQASNESWHPRATPREICKAFVSNGYPFIRNKYWCQAQSLHYGLPKPKAYEDPHTPLLKASRARELSVPPSVRRCEMRLREDWNQASEITASPRRRRHQVALSQQASIASSSTVDMVGLQTIEIYEYSSEDDSSSISGNSVSSQLPNEPDMDEVPPAPQGIQPNNAQNNPIINAIGAHPVPTAASVNVSTILGVGGGILWADEVDDSFLCHILDGASGLSR